MSTKEKELEVVIYIGMPASGKTSASKDFIRKNPNYVKVSRDDFRHMLKNQGVCEPKIESMINDLMDQTIIKALSKKLNVIVDGTNLKEHKIRDIIKLVNPYANVSYRTFDFPYKTVVERNSKRENPVDEIAMNNMWEDWEILKDSFDFQPVKRNKTVTRFYLKQDKTLPKAIICDLDGSLALSDGRDYYDESLVEYDNVNEPLANMVRNYDDLVILVSGRSYGCQKETENWLKANNIRYDYLFMRGEDDIRKDKFIKEDIFENCIKDKFYVEYVLDDRDQVVATWRKLGLLCLQVYYGYF